MGRCTLLVWSREFIFGPFRNLLRTPLYVLNQDWNGTFLCLSFALQFLLMHWRISCLLCISIYIYYLLWFFFKLSSWFYVFNGLLRKQKETCLRAFSGIVRQRTGWYEFPSGILLYQARKFRIFHHPLKLPNLIFKHFLHWLIYFG